MVAILFVWSGPVPVFHAHGTLVCEVASVHGMESHLREYHANIDPYSNTWFGLHVHLVPSEQGGGFLADPGMDVGGRGRFLRITGVDNFEQFLVGVIDGAWMSFRTMEFPPEGLRIQPVEYDSDLSLCGSLFYKSIAFRC